MSTPTYQTISKHDTLTMASTAESAFEILTHIMDNGKLLPQYTYVYTLFDIFNGIYHNGAPLNPGINNSLQGEINHDFNRAHYHVSVAIGLAAGIITSPGVGPELSNAKDWLNKATNNINSLKTDPYQVIADGTTKAYIEGLQKASDDPALNVNILVKQVLWSAIVDLNNQTATKTDFEDLLMEIHLKLQKLRDAGWKDVFQLEGLKINVDNPGTDDDLTKVAGIIQDVGFFVGLACIGLQIYLWKTQGPGRILRSIIRVFRPEASDAEIADIGATGAAVGEEEVAELSMTEILSGALAVIGALLLVIGTIIEIVQLKKQLDSINNGKNNFNNEFSKLVNQLQTLIQSSEKFRRHSA